MLAHHTQQKAADKRWRVCFYSIIDGSIADSTSLNLYTYVNGNPISFVDPFGLSADRGNHPEPDWNPSGNFPIDGSFLERELGFIDNIKANTILNPKYDSIVIKALNNTAEAIIRHYRNKNKDNIEAEYAPYKNAIDHLIYSIQSKTPLQDFGDGIRIRIEISESVNTSFFNVIGDIAGFVPVLGEVYSIVDFISEEYQIYHYNYQREIYLSIYVRNNSCGKWKNYWGRNSRRIIKNM